MHIHVHFGRMVTPRISWTDPTKHWEKPKSKPSDDWKSYKILRNKCSIKTKKSKIKPSIRTLNNNINNPKKFWSDIEKVFPGKSKLTWNVTSDRHPTVNVLSRFYSTMALNLKKSYNIVTDFAWRFIPKLTPKPTKTFRFP